MDANAAAVYMVEYLEGEEALYQEMIVYQLIERFGEAAAYQNDSGGLSIARPILRAFRALTEGQVVWDRTERCWRKRQPGDLPSRLAG